MRVEAEWSFNLTEDFIMSTNGPDIAVALYDQHNQAENAVRRKWNSPMS
jgi:hypothetical protein